MSPLPPSVVITGSTRGIGLGMAKAFLDLGCNVVVSGRGAARVTETVAALGATGDRSARTLGVPCDVARYEDVNALFRVARDRFGRVDVWINNAGTSNPQRAFSEQDPETIQAVVNANLLGTMFGARVAAKGMLEQGSGQIYNMEGFGSDGAIQPGMAAYGSTKRAVRYFTRALASELAKTPILVCTLSPGIVVTDLLVDVYRNGDPENFRRQRWLFNFIADPAEIVCPWLARAVLSNTRSGRHLAWMTVPKAMLRFFLPRYHRRDLFAAHGL